MEKVANLRLSFYMHIVFIFLERERDPVKIDLWPKPFLQCGQQTVCIDHGEVSTHGPWTRFRGLCTLTIR